MEIDEQSFNQLTRIIEYINESHLTFSNQHKDFFQWNLKTKRIDSLFDDEIYVVDAEFMQYVYEYTNLLRSLYPELLDFFTGVSSIDYRIRIKERGSIDGKVYRYSLSNHQDGKISINKCLNDLVGFRVIIKGFNNKLAHYRADLEKICKGLSIRFVPRHIDDYDGIHLYFRNKNNQFFPWELQIWDADDEHTNNLSHELHREKRRYTQWPDEYKRGKIERG